MPEKCQYLSRQILDTQQQVNILHEAEPQVHAASLGGSLNKCVRIRLIYKREKKMLRV